MTEQEWREWLEKESLWWMFANIPFRPITMKQLRGLK